MSERQSIENNENNMPEKVTDYGAYAQDMLDGNASVKAEMKPRSKKVDGNVDFQTRVNDAIKEVTIDEETGKYVYPDDISEELKYAVAAEKKFRDTQGSYTKNQISLKEVETENEALREQLAKLSNTTLELSQADADRLDDLKFSDPSAWRRELNALEIEHSTNAQKKLDESMGEVRKKAGAQFELDRRFEVLKQFNEDRKTPITVEMLDDDIPPRITKKLADGLLTFEGYLAEVDEYLSKGKVVSNPSVDNGTKLTQSAGSTTPSSANEQQGQVDYSTMTF